MFVFELVQYTPEHTHKKIVKFAKPDILNFRNAKIKAALQDLNTDSHYTCNRTTSDTSITPCLGLNGLFCPCCSDIVWSNLFYDADQVFLNNV